MTQAGPSSNLTPPPANIEPQPVAPGSQIPLNSTQNEHEETGNEGQIRRRSGIDESVIWIETTQGPSPARIQGLGQNRVNGNGLLPDWNKGIGEIRSEIERQRIQFEERFEVEHHARIRQAEANKLEMNSHREFIEQKIAAQCEELKKVMEGYLFEIIV